MTNEREGLRARRQKLALEAIATGATYTDAAEAAGVDRTTLWRWRETDEEFAAALKQAEESSTDILERVARRRAIEGVEEPVIYQGQLTYIYERDEWGHVIHDIVQREYVDAEGNVQVRNVQLPRVAVDEHGQPRVLTVRKPNDQVLMMLLKGRRKEVYAERREITGKDGADLKPAQVIVATGVPSIDDLV